MAGLRTEFPFRLPKGFVDGDGEAHRNGTMRLATARDELEPLNDPKVKDADDPYLSIIVLSRVITQLGPHLRLSNRDVDGLFAADLAHLQDVYATINYGTDAEIAQYLQTLQQPADRAPDIAVAGPVASTPVSDAARSIMARPELDAAADDVEDDGADAVSIRSPRRGRIEEVGRSSGPRT